MALTSYSYKVGSAPDTLAAAVVASEKTPVGTLVQYGSNLLQFIGDGSVVLGNVTDYDIVAAKNPDLLVTAVNESIAAGRQPVGNPLYRSGILHVVMGKITVASGSGSDYTLPAATVDALGGVKLAAKVSTDGLTVADYSEVTDIDTAKAAIAAQKTAIDTLNTTVSELIQALQNSGQMIAAS